MKNKLAARRKEYDELLKRSGIGPATKGNMIRNVNGVPVCYIRPGSNKK